MLRITDPGAYAVAISKPQLIAIKFAFEEPVREPVGVAHRAHSDADEFPNAAALQQWD